MGHVHLAQHPRLPRRDALKILPSNLRSFAVTASGRPFSIANGRVRP
jgi:hypothetical protein